MDGGCLPGLGVAPRYLVIGLYGVEGVADGSFKGCEGVAGSGGGLAAKASARRGGLVESGQRGAQHRPAGGLRRGAGGGPPGLWAAWRGGDPTDPSRR